MVIGVGIVAVVTMGTEDLQDVLHIEVGEIILPDTLHIEVGEIILLDAHLMLEGRDVRDPGHILLMKGSMVVGVDRLKTVC